jgi:NADH dehydrogenase
MVIDIPKEGSKRVVIIGGGFGGIELGKKLAGKDEVQVVIIDRNNYHTFQPLLYQAATAALEPTSIAYPIRKIFNKYRNFYFRMGDVHEIIPSANKIIFDDDEITYDYAVIATGAKTNYFGNRSITVNSMSMKNVVEAIDLRNLIFQNFEHSLTTSDPEQQKALRTIVIAGGGPTGVELAGSLGELKTKVLKKDFPEIKQEDIRIYLVHADPRVLPTFSEKSSERALRYLEKLGVSVMLNTLVKEYDNDTMITQAGLQIKTHTLVWTAGVTGDPIKGIPAESINRANRILVDDYNKVKGLNNVYAIGDVACMVSEKYPHGHPQVAPPAMQQGKLLGKNIVEMERNGKPSKFVYKDKGSMATVGKNKAVVEIGRFKLGGFVAWFMWMAVHLLSLVGFRNRIAILINWISYYFTRGVGSV